ncbi:AMP-binding protein [Halioxenophilus sp. WMMB6]|uniref:AMP-binding protein n=1 Tax=Halioxenophilus sp. WMMB6 TaxID=3073815 RepID=UPI00295EFD97|nr:AMP-binding protein [Halioxenophilus sp. WMMB6]
MLIDPVATFAIRTPSALACVDLTSGQRWDYREFDRAINRVANWLVERLGPASGERVATVARNSANGLILSLACVRAGAIYVPCNWRLATEEVALIVADSQPQITFCDDEFRTAAATSLTLSELLNLTACQPTVPPLQARRELTEVSTLLYTSGTSGSPKGVMLSELNALASQFAFNSGNNVSASSVFLCDMPMFHTAGLFVNARAPLLAGGAVLVSQGFNPGVTLQRLSDSKLAISHYFSVPQMASMLWDHPDFDAAKLQHLQVYATGGAPNSKEQIQRFVDAGIPMSDGYGMTEAGSIAGIPVGNPELAVRKAGSCGAIFLTVETKIVDEQGETVVSGESGELWVRGPGVTAGYWRQPEKTEEAFRDGWLMTGDMARLDGDGFLFIVDRKKDMFISGGENVYPAEVERVIASMPSVASVAVVGVADAQWGEKGVAFVVPATGKTLNLEEIEHGCREKLAPYKVPKHFVLAASLPYSTTGKLQKDKLRATFLVTVTK